MKVFVAIVLCVTMVMVSCDETDCPSFGEWMETTKECIWFPFANMREKFAQACQTNITMTKQYQSQFDYPKQPCGFCSFKLQCRKREKKEGCFSLDAKKTPCEEHGSVCTMDPHPVFDCRLGAMTASLQNCANRVDIPDWRRDAYRKFSEGLPYPNCIKVADKCKCCCHPYTPSADGMKCEEQTEASCQPYGKFNEWSQCLWFPLADIAKNIREHCQLELKGELPKNLVATPAGFQIPEKCGYCSFKARCRKRDRKDGCFHIDADKKACGPDDCPTCGDICSMTKVGDSCDWGQIVGKTVLTKVEGVASAMPYWKKRGIKRLLRHVPFGTCKEVEGKCKCCCYPYEPNEDGTQCVLTPLCSFDPTH